MPVLCFRSNCNLSLQIQQQFMREASKVVAEILGRDSCQVMTSYSSCEMLFGDTSLPSMYIEVQSFNSMDERQRRKMCMSLLNVITRIASIDSSRIYIHFIDVHSYAAWKFINGQALCPDSLIDGEFSDE